MRWPRAVFGLLSLSLALGTAPAVAEPTLADLTAQFALGRFLTAADAAEAAGGADRLSFGAQSLLALYMTDEGAPDPALLDRAQRLSEAALALDPVSADARLQLAIALSLKGRAVDLMEALRAGYARDGRRLVVEALRREPDNPYLHAFLAVWNIEVRRRGGAVGAGYMGASLGKARDSYDRAASIAPDDVGIHWQYARALVALDARAHRADAMEVLERAVAAHAGDRLEQVMQARAAQLMEAMRSDDAAAVALAAGML